MNRIEFEQNKIEKNRNSETEQSVDTSKTHHSLIGQARRMLRNKTSHANTAK